MVGKPGGGWGWEVGRKRWIRYILFGHKITAETQSKMPSVMRTSHSRSYIFPTTLKSEKSLSDNYFWHFEVMSLIILLLNYHNLSQKQMQNEACHFDGANHIDLFVYKHPIFPKQCSGQRDLPLLVPRANFLCATICFHECLGAILMAKSLKSNWEHERYIVNSALSCCKVTYTWKPNTDLSHC